MSKFDDQAEEKSMKYNMDDELAHVNPQDFEDKQDSMSSL
jgi:hypothetical protein